MIERTEFLARLPALLDAPGSPAAALFDRDRAVTAARAPGRLDVMGGIADYSGSLVLQLPIREATWAVAQRRADHDEVRVASLPADSSTSGRTDALPMPELARLAREGYGAARAFFAERGDAWVAYVVGVLLVLARERGAELRGGLDLLIWSEVPEAKGVSSSAALEVATMQAVAALFGVALDGVDLARLCQVVENYVVGAPCGIMDQMTSALGEPDRLLALRCQPAVVEGFVAIPPEIAFWGLDSGIRHAVSGSDYTSVRTGAFMGYRILAEHLGFESKGPATDGCLAIDDPTYQGYLANIDPMRFDGALEPYLPIALTGGAFLDRYQGTTDLVTRVDPARRYAVRIPTRHPVHENARVRAFRDHLTRPIHLDSIVAMGRLMGESHASYSACGLGCEATDLIVSLVREAGPKAGLFGAKITGGGSGGTVAILGRSGAEESVAWVADQYTQRTGRVPHVFSGSSPGAARFGVFSAELSPGGPITPLAAP